MGTDLSMFVERREGGGWRPADPLVRYQETALGQVLDVWWGPPDIYPGVPDGVLFDRLGLGAGHAAPIVEPRGLPADLSPELRLHAEKKRDLFHLHGWLLAAELSAIDVDGGPQCQSWVTDELLPQLAGRGVPRDVRVVYWFW